MKTVRKLRNLAKLKNSFPTLSDNLLFSACLLLKKSLLLNSIIIKSLNYRTNIFKLQEFEKILKTEDYKNIKNHFKINDKIYQKFWNQMNSKFIKEVNNSILKKDLNKFKNFGINSLRFLDEKMRKLFNIFDK